MTVRERILIVGNGFDLAHFLPTKYEHFIHTMKVVEKAPSDRSLSFDYLYKDFLDSEDYILVKCKELYKIEELEITAQKVDILKYKLIDNGWFQFFKSQVDSGIDTWIDFENEVEKLLNSVCVLLEEIEQDDRSFITRTDKTEAFLQARLITEKMSRKHPALYGILWRFNIIEKEQIDRDKLTLNKEFIKYYYKRAVHVNTSKIFSNLINQWNDFIGIFSTYIEFINTFKPKKN